MKNIVIKYRRILNYYRLVILSHMYRYVVGVRHIFSDPHLQEKSPIELSNDDLFDNPVMVNYTRLIFSKNTIYIHLSIMHITEGSSDDIEHYYLTKHKDAIAIIKYLSQFKNSETADYKAQSIVDLYINLALS